MAKGKSKGFKKTVLTIEDPLIEPYYFQQDELQFTLYKRESTLAVGYYSNLALGLKRISRDQLIKKHAHKKLTLSEYITEYNQTVNNLTSKLDS